MFSELAIDHIQNRRYRGHLPSATHIGYSGKAGDGPFCVIYLEVADGIVQSASYETNGCPSAIASAGILVQLSLQREVIKLRECTAHDLAMLVGQLPAGKEDCPVRAVQALKDALSTQSWSSSNPK